MEELVNTQLDHTEGEQESPYSQPIGALEPSGLSLDKLHLV